MPSPTDVVNAIEPDLSSRTTILGCLSTTALGRVSSVAGASSTAGAAATAATAASARARLARHPLAVRPPAQRNRRSSPRRSRLHRDPLRRAVAAPGRMHMLAAPPTASPARHTQSKRGQTRSGRSARIGPACPVAVGARHDSENTRLHAHCSSGRRRLRLLRGSHATCVADRAAVASCIALAGGRRTPRSATACARRSRRTHAQSTRRRSADAAAASRFAAQHTVQMAIMRSLGHVS